MTDTTNLETGVAEAAQDENLDNNQIVNEDLENEQIDNGNTDDNPDADIQADDTEEVEYEGNKYKLPKELKDALLRNADYTRKTQEVAETRKAVEAERQENQRMQKVYQDNFAEMAEAYSLDNQIKQYNQIDWNALIDSDPVQAHKLERQLRQMEARRDEIVVSITQKQQTQTLEEQQATAKRLQEGRAVLERDIPGWSQELAETVISHGKTLGYYEWELRNVQDPRHIKVLHKAWQFDQLQKRQAVKKPEPQAKPVTRIGAAKGTATKDPSQMSDVEFAAWRKSHIKKRSA